MSVAHPLAPVQPRPRRAARALGVLAVASLVALVPGCSTDEPAAASSASATTSEDRTGPSFAEWAESTRSALEQSRGELLEGLAESAVDDEPAPGAGDGTTSTALPVWGVPVGLEGWTVTQLDVDGLTKLASDEGCTLGTQQLHVAFDTDDDRAASEDLLVQLVGADSYVPAGLPLLTVSGPGGPLELLQHHAIYATPDSAVEYRYLSRAITAQDSGLVLAYSCPVGVFDESGWLAMLALTSVAHTTATTM